MHSNDLTKKRIAVIGSGISGLTAAYYLSKKYDVWVFESDSRIGGHTATKDVNVDGKNYAIDTGFIVFNDWTYPNFMRLMDELGVKSQPTDMGFSVFEPHTGFEYSGTNLRTLFAKKRNLFSYSHWKMLADIVRFNKEAIRDLENGILAPDESLGEYLTKNTYSPAFIHRYLIPMGSAIWSATQGAMLNFPLKFFVQFFKNHGLLNITNRPQWRVIQGGSREYLEPLTARFKHQIVTNCTIASIIRQQDWVEINFSDKKNHTATSENFDQVIFACHSDQALRLIKDASTTEKNLLSSIPYQENSVVLHTDQRLMPQRKIAWSSWNYCLDQSNHLPPILTYSMNILQSIKSETEFLVTLNAKEKIDPNKILGEYTYAHPVFSQTVINVQQQWSLINGVNRTWFCGAYWFNGFHEDGVKSGIRVAEGLGVSCA